MAIEIASIWVRPKRERRRFRLGLRAMMALVALSAVLCAVWQTYLGPYYRETLSIGRIRALGRYSGQVVTEPRGNFLVRQFFGDDLSQKAVYVSLIDGAGYRVDDDWLEANLADLHHVEYLLISSPNVTDRGLAHVARLRSLMSLTLDRTRATDEGIERLKKEARNLKFVGVQR